MDLKEIDKQVAKDVFGWDDFRDYKGIILGYPPEELKMGIEAESQRVPSYTSDAYANQALIDKYVISSLKIGEYWFSGVFCDLGLQPFQIVGSMHYQSKHHDRMVSICLAAIAIANSLKSKNNTERSQ